jgi:hypothetical protein
MVETVPQQALQEPQNRDATIAPAAQPQLHGMAEWVHDNRDATKNPVGHTIYQVIRNLCAAVPYGIATVGVWSGFERLEKYAVPRAATSSFFEGVRKFAKSPAKDIAMIAAGFTLYRGTLKLVKFTKERLFNPENTEADTKREVEHFGDNLVKDFKEIAPAEVNSTPIGAVALGLGRRVVAGVEDYGKRPVEHTIGAAPLDEHAKAHQSLFKDRLPNGQIDPKGKLKFSNFSWTEFSNKVFHKASMPFAEAAIFIASFVAFFELSDRLYKDVQIRRGIHKENHNSISRVAPEKADIKEQQERAQGLDKDANYQIEKRGEGKDNTLFGSEPNLGRFLMTRVLSTALGIGAYTFTKRASYATLGHFTSAPTFAGKAIIEGLATSTFFTMCMSNDIIEGLYNKYIAKPQPPKTPAQQQNHDVLLAKLDEKYKANGVAA